MDENTDNSALFEAAERNDFEEIKRLVEENGISVSSVNWVDETVAHIAAKNGNFNIVKYALEKDPAIATVKDTYGNTILSEAVEYGHLDIIKYVVEHCKADISQPIVRFSGQPDSVHLAARSGQLAVLKYFIEEKNAKVDGTENELKETLAISAAKNKHHDVIKYLLEERHADLTKVDSNGDNILYTAVKEGDLALMKYILDEKKVPLDVNWRNNSGKTLLHLTTFFNNVEILSYLVEEKHADINITDNEGKTPLHTAAHYKHEESCEYLIQHGANMEQKDKNGKNPKEEAADESFVKFMEDALQKRSRRSISEPSFSWALQHNTWSVSSREAVYRLAGHSVNSLSGSSAFVMNFLEVAGIFVGRGRQNNVRGMFPSPREIINNRLDPVALDAIQSIPN